MTAIMSYFSNHPKLIYSPSDIPQLAKSKQQRLIPMGTKNYISARASSLELEFPCKYITTPL